MKRMRLGGRRGFTLAELMAALAIAGVVFMCTYRLILSEFRAYGQQNALEDVTETLRGAGVLLSWEIRHAEMASDDLMSTSPDTLSVRSIQGVGIICAINSATARYAIWKNGGDIEATADDSALVYVQGPALWKKLKITQVGTAAAMGIASCAWTGVRSPDIVVQLGVASSSDTAGIAVGSIFRSFRRTTFAEYQSGSKWWLGRKVGSASWETVTGPLLAPASHGLQLGYYDSTGTTSTDTTRIRQISVVLRAQSYRQYRSAEGAMGYRGDSMATRIMLRR